MFDGKLEPEACMELLEALENHFKQEEILANQRVKVEKSKLKVLALSWWKFLQNERVEQEKQPISTQKKMMVEIIKHFVPEDYEVRLHKRLHNLKQKDMDVTTYTQEFNTLTLRAKLYENEKQKLARYISELRYIILPSIHHSRKKISHPFDIPSICVGLQFL